MRTPIFLIKLVSEFYCVCDLYFRGCFLQPEPSCLEFQVVIKLSCCSGYVITKIKLHLLNEAGIGYLITFNRY